MTIETSLPASDTHQASANVRDLLAEAYPDEELIFFDPASLDVAVVGVAERLGLGPVVVYDREKLLQAFVDDGMDREEAEEWVSFNIDGAYIGDKTPLLMTSTKTLQDLIA